LQQAVTACEATIAACLGEDGGDAKAASSPTISSNMISDPMPQHFQHPNALVETHDIGEGTRVWAFAHVLPGAKIGKDCNVCDGVFIENQVTIGDRVTVKCGVQLWDGITLEDDVFIGPNATFTNDALPRSKRYPAAYARTIVKRGASVGANATLLPGLTIGANAMVGAGAVVTRDVPPNAIVVGNPARITGYVDTEAGPPASQEPAIASDGLPALLIAGAKLYRLPRIADLRGSLVFGEIAAQLPFHPQRFFLVFDVSSREVRGEHAHRELHEFLVCLRGSCSLALDDGQSRQEVVLDSPTVGLHVPPRVWRVHYKYTPDAMLLALCSDIYRADDYVRDYDEFKRLVQSRIPDQR
jgi:UDP-2-acetamido-3-amino-2,3-dideoxy-glucuronate N-acetyltransferase